MTFGSRKLRTRVITAEIAPRALALGVCCSCRHMTAHGRQLLGAIRQRPCQPGLQALGTGGTELLQLQLQGRKISRQLRQVLRQRLKKPDRLLQQVQAQHRQDCQKQRKQEQREYGRHKSPPQAQLFTEKAHGR